MQISKHVHALKIPFTIPIGPDRLIDRFVYVFLIYGSRICLIDTGVAAAAPIIIDYIRKTGRDPEEISLAILSHSHPDHIGAAAMIRQETGCTIAAHRAEKSWIEDIDLQGRERPVPGFAQLVGGSVTVDRLIEDNDLVELDADLSLRVLHTPGHSPGSVSLYLEAEEALFAGDVVPVPGDLPIYVDVPASVASIRRLQEIPGLQMLLSAWDQPRSGSEIGQVLAAGLAQLQKIHETVLDIAGPGKQSDPVELCRQVVGRLGLPPFAANPLVARSFAANLAASGTRNLLA